MNVDSKPQSIFIFLQCLLSHTATMYKTSFISQNSKLIPLICALSVLSLFTYLPLWDESGTTSYLCWNNLHEDILNLHTPTFKKSV